MTFEVYLSRKSLKTLKQLEDRMSKRIKDVLLTLRTTPLPIKEYDVKKVLVLKIFIELEYRNTGLSTR